VKLDLHTLRPEALNQAIVMLDEEWIYDDPVIAPVIPVVLGRGVGQDWHKAGTFRHHLIGVTRTLTLWQQPDELRLLGLLHSVYGNAHVDLMKFDPQSERGKLAELVGEDVERLIYTFCKISRVEFVRQLFAGNIEDDGSVTLTSGDQPWVLPARDVAIFAVMTMADICEQWYSWQDDIYSGYPDYEFLPGKVHWAAGLWPGPMRPTTYRVSQMSRLGQVLQHPAIKGILPEPPVFNQCSVRLEQDDEAAASALYWSVAQQNQPLVSPQATAASLKQAIALNPWVAEPHLLLAQLHLTFDEFDQAHAAAASGVQLLSIWGNTWDKRIGWDAWMAWGRNLLQSAEKRSWPKDINKINNLALDM
jgi:hypothetical protein